MVTLLKDPFNPAYKAFVALWDSYIARSYGESLSVADLHDWLIHHPVISVPAALSTILYNIRVFGNSLKRLTQAETDVCYYWWHTKGALVAELVNITPSDETSPGLAGKLLPRYIAPLLDCEDCDDPDEKKELKGWDYPWFGKIVNGINSG